MRASIVISCYNVGELDGKTVQSCLETTDGLDCELVVGDDASTDGSVEALRARIRDVRIVRHAERRGIALTKDLGARSARGDVLVFLDGHCKPEPGAIATLVEGVEQLAGRAVVTPRIANLDTLTWQNDVDQVGHGYAMNLETFDTYWIDLDDLQPTLVKGKKYFAQPALIGCCAAMSRELYDRVWGWDTAMRGYGAEDIDLGLKVWLLGGRLLHDVEPMIGHRFRAGFDTYTFADEDMVANQLRMARKNFSDATWFGWLDRFSARYPAEFWEVVWKTFLVGQESLERERAYLMAHRIHDELWYARKFDLRWPPARPAAATSGNGVAAVHPSSGHVSSEEPTGQTSGSSPSPAAGALRNPGRMGLSSTRSPSPSPRPLRTGGTSPSPSPRPVGKSPSSPSPSPRPKGGRSPSPGPPAKLMRQASPSPEPEKKRETAPAKPSKKKPPRSPERKKK